MCLDGTVLHAQDSCVLWVFRSQETGCGRAVVYETCGRAGSSVFYHRLSSGALSAFPTAVLYLQTQAKLLEVIPSVCTWTVHT